VKKAGWRCAYPAYKSVAARQKKTAAHGQRFFINALD